MEELLYRNEKQYMKINDPLTISWKRQYLTIIPLTRNAFIVIRNHHFSIKRKTNKKLKMKEQTSGKCSLLLSSMICICFGQCKTKQLAMFPPYQDLSVNTLMFLNPPFHNRPHLNSPFFIRPSNLFLTLITSPIISQQNINRSISPISIKCNLLSTTSQKLTQPHVTVQNLNLIMLLDPT